MKYSRQRDLIHETVVQSDRHPTADDVYQQVRKKIPTVSLATVYRNLNQLADLHIIRGRVIDIWPDQPLADQLLHLSKEQITGYDLVLYGLCKNCAQSE